MSNNKVKNTIIASASTIAAVATAGVAANADSVTIQSGDTLNKLASEHHTTVSKIAEDNHISNVNLIFAGDTIEVNAPASTTTSANSVVSTQNADGTVTVVAGDTIYGIAARFNVPAETLIANNGGSSLLLVGQKLSLSNNSVPNDTQENTAQTQTTSAATTSQNVAPQTQAPVASTAAPQTTVANGSWVDVAKSLLGIPYVWGGSTTSGFDCSGFVQYVRAHAGQSNLGRTTYQQAATLRATGSQPKPFTSAKPGDLLFWGGVGSEYHVEIYLGGGQAIGATTPGQASSIHAVWGNPVAYSA
ncbi:MAG: LysM peptidoglycan-binding domain-containing protein [Lactobacillaceae bacterium]|jgi:cell wall-associated NlpC family hydrolase|nr:LysM peptidoglycan-binding domain-containing protein [Lactobacillaceae bacterium]